MPRGTQNYGMERKNRIKKGTEELKRVYITMGDPRGIGPEVIFKSLKRLMGNNANEKFVPVIVGDEDILKEYASRYRINIVYEKENNEPEKGVFYQPVKTMKHPGRDALNYIKKGVELCENNPGSVLVTSPVEKKIIARIEKGFKGHTEYIAKLLAVKTAAMTFITPEIKMSVVTAHIPHKKVSSRINEDCILEHVRTVNAGLKRWFKIGLPRIAICGLNPHAGEEGLLGSEENEIFSPAIERLKKEKIDIAGPLSAEAALKAASKGYYDFVVSIFHDQLLPGVKAFLGPAVNFTMGLPLVRTSPDHGPAIDITGKGSADFSSMKYAIQLALDLAHL